MSHCYFTTGGFRQSVRLGAKTLDVHDPCGYNLYIFAIAAGPRLRSHSRV
jgi:hypothetical protein